MVRRKQPDGTPLFDLLTFEPEPVSAAAVPSSSPTSDPTPSPSKNKKRSRQSKSLRSAQLSLVPQLPLPEPEILPPPADSPIETSSFLRWIRIVDQALETISPDLNRLAVATQEDQQLGRQALATWQSIRRAAEENAADRSVSLTETVAGLYEVVQQQPQGLVGILIVHLFQLTSRFLRERENAKKGELSVTAAWELVSYVLRNLQNCLLPLPAQTKLYAIRSVGSPVESTLADRLEMFLRPVFEQVSVEAGADSIENLWAQIWLASQESLSDLQDATRGLVDPYLVLLMLLAGGMLEARAQERKEYIGALDTSIAMAKDLALDAHLIVANHRKKTPRGVTGEAPVVEIVWQTKLPGTEMPATLQKVQSWLLNGGFTENSGEDLFGAAQQTVVLRTRQPQIVLNHLPAPDGYAEIHLLNRPQPVLETETEQPEEEPVEWALFSEQELGVVDFPGRGGTESGKTPRQKVNRGQRGGRLGKAKSGVTKIFTGNPVASAEKEAAALVANKYPRFPCVVAFTGGLGLLNDLVATGATVLWGHSTTTGAKLPLLSLFLSFGEGIIQAIPDSPTTAAQLSRYEKELKQHGVTLLVAPTRDDLQVWQVTRQVTGIVQAGLSRHQYLELQRSRTLTALEQQRTVSVWPEMDDQTLASLSTETDRYLQILLPAAADPGFCARLQSIFMQVSPYLRVEVINGGQSGATVLGFL